MTDEIARQFNQLLGHTANSLSSEVNLKRLTSREWPWIESNSQ